METFEQIMSDIINAKTNVQIIQAPIESKNKFRPYNKDRFDMNDYKGGYTYNFTMNMPMAKIDLEEIFEMFNIRIPNDFKGHSLSVSDLVVLEENNVKQTYFVNSFGFVKIA